MPLQQIVANQANAEIPVNENFQALDYLSVYARKAPTSIGLTWGYYGGYWQGFTIADGTLALTANATNYVVVNRSNGVISTSTSNVNWLNTVEYARVYIAITGSATVTSVQDFRLDKSGIYISFTQSLNELNDTDIGTRFNGQGLVYSSASDKWEPEYVPNIDIPPTLNDAALVFKTATSTWELRFLPKFTISSTAPISPQINDIWINI